MKSRSRSASLCAAIVLLLSAADAQAELAIIARFEGVEGPVEIRDIRGAISGLEFAQTWFQELDKTGRPVPRAVNDPPTLTMTSSQAVVQLTQHMLSQKEIPRAVIALVDRQGEEFLEFYRIRFDKVLISGLETNLAGEEVLHTVTFESESQEHIASGGGGVEQLLYLRGDTNGDLVADISDAIKLLTYLFLGGDFRCIASGDVNGDLTVDLSDAVFELSFLFGGGRTPPPPFPSCDLAPAVLPCDASPCI